MKKFLQVMSIIMVSAVVIITFISAMEISDEELARMISIVGEAQSASSVLESSGFSTDGLIRETQVESAQGNSETGSASSGTNTVQYKISQDKTSNEWTISTPFYPLEVVIKEQGAIVREKMVYKIVSIICLASSVLIQAYFILKENRSGE